MVLVPCRTEQDALFVGEVDGEGYLAESTKFRQILSTHGYTLQKTTTDPTSQNGLAERPHLTLGAVTQCLFYAAAIPVSFWADAMLYTSNV
jgi:hypothetical protein